MIHASLAVWRKEGAIDPYPKFRFGGSSNARFENGQVQGYQRLSRSASGVCPIKITVVPLKCFGVVKVKDLVFVSIKLPSSRVTSTLWTHCWKCCLRRSLNADCDFPKCRLRQPQTPLAMVTKTFCDSLKRCWQWSFRFQCRCRGLIDVELPAVCCLLLVSDQPIIFEQKSTSLGVPKRCRLASNLACALRI